MTKYNMAPRKKEWLEKILSGYVEPTIAPQIPKPVKEVKEKK